MKFEIPEHLFINFGKTVLTSGQCWNMEHLRKIERVVDETLKEESSLANSTSNASISNAERRSFWSGPKNVNLINFIKSFFNIHFENYQDDLNKRGKLINFDNFIAKDFENCEKGKKALIMTLPQKNLIQNPYYFLNKAMYLFYFKERRGKDSTIIHSRALLNVI